MAQVGAAYVRIRPYVAEEDARALRALHDLARGIDAAFQSFHAALADGTPEGTRPGPETPALRMAEPPGRDTDTDTQEDT